MCVVTFLDTTFFGASFSGVIPVPEISWLEDVSPRFGVKRHPKKKTHHLGMTTVVFKRCVQLLSLNQVTPPKFNIVPEKWWLEDCFPIGFR